MSTEELRILSRAAWEESERLGGLCDTCPLQDRPQAVKDWQAAFVKAGQASRLYRTALEAPPCP